MSAFDYFTGSAHDKALGLFQLLREDGTPVDGDLDLDRELARTLFEGMVRIRVTDARMMALQRQGRIGTYGPCRGQEAAHCASTIVMEKEDWVVHAFREPGSFYHRGWPLERILQFAHVARPVIAGQHVDGRRGDAPDALSMLARELVEKVVREQEQV